jgi:site-specific recombinase XerD
MKKRFPDYVHGYTDRLGKARHYYKRAGNKPVSLPGLPWSPEFMAAYDAAHAAYIQPDAIEIGASRTVRGTLDAALVLYYSEKGSFKDLAPGTQGPQRSLLERWRKDHGKLPLRQMLARHIQKYISKLESPSVQRNMLRAIRHFTKFALSASLIDNDPAVSITRAKMKATGGHPTWTEEHAALYEAKHPVGTQARLAYELYLNLGVRKSDVVRIGPRYVRNGILNNFLPQKTSTTGGKKISIKLFETTRVAIEATPVTGTDTYLITSFGKAFTAKGFGKKMRQWCDEAGLPPIVDLTGKTKNLASHGLRKLFMIRLVHAGYNAMEIASLSGHKDLREIQTYIDEFDRQKVGIKTSTTFEKVQKVNRDLLTE